MLYNPVRALAIDTTSLTAALRLTRYIPQAVLNEQRRSVVGFSVTGIIIKHVGACFLFVNAAYLGEHYPVVLYGLFNVVQHSFFMYQLRVELVCCGVRCAR